MMRSVSGSNSSRGIAAVVGVGPRLGSAVARKFASEGYTIAILSRDLGTSLPLPSSSLASLQLLFLCRLHGAHAARQVTALLLARAEKLSQLAEEIAQEAKGQVFALRVDCTDARSVREAFEGVLSLGPVEVLVYNACEPPDADEAPAPHPTPFLAVTPDAFHLSLAVSAAGAFHCAQQARRPPPFPSISSTRSWPQLRPLWSRALTVHTWMMDGRSSRGWWSGAGAPSSSRAPRRPSPASPATPISVSGRPACRVCCWQTANQLVACFLSLKKLILGTNERVQAAASLPFGVCPSRWPGSSSRPACTLRM